MQPSGKEITECCVSSGRGDYNQLRHLLAELMKLGLERWVWVGSMEKKGGHFRKGTGMSRGTEWGAHEACLSHSKWTTRDALDGSHERAPGDKVNKKVRLPGPRSDAPFMGYGTPWRPELFSKINLVMIGGMGQGRGQAHKRLSQKSSQKRIRWCQGAMSVVFTTINPVWIPGPGIG